jgi:hypothetical protein
LLTSLILKLPEIFLDQLQVLLQGLLQLAFYQLTHGGAFIKLRVVKIIAQVFP